MLAPYLIAVAVSGQFVPTPPEPYELSTLSMNLMRDSRSPIFFDDFRAPVLRIEGHYPLEFILSVNFRNAWARGRVLGGPLPGIISTQQVMIPDPKSVTEGIINIVLDSTLKRFNLQAPNVGGNNWSVGSIGAIADSTFGRFNLQKPMCFDGYTEIVHDESLADALLCLTDILQKNDEIGQYWILVDMLPFESVSNGNNLVFTMLVMFQNYFAHDGSHPYAGTPASLREGLKSGNLNEKSFTIRAAYTVPMLRRGNIVDALAGVDIVTGETHLPPQLYHQDDAPPIVAPRAVATPPREHGVFPWLYLVMFSALCFGLYSSRRLRRIQRIKDKIPPELQLTVWQTASYLFRPLKPLITYQRSCAEAVKQRAEELAKTRAEEQRRIADLETRQNRERRLHAEDSVAQSTSNPKLTPVQETVTKEEITELEMAVQKAMRDPHLTADSRSILIRELARAKGETRPARQKKFLQYAIEKIEYSRPDRRQVQ